MNYYIINPQALTISSGPHSATAPEVKKVTRCGNPDILSDLYLAALGVVPEVSPDYDPQTQTYDGVTVTATAVTKTIRALTAEELADRLTFRQAQVWENIKAYRDTLEDGGVFVAGKWWHTDIKSRAKYLGLPLMGAAVDGIQWKTMDKSMQALSAELVTQIFQAVAIADTNNFANAETHRLAMVVASNLPPEDVGYIAPEDYDFTSGWTGSYQA